MPSNEFEIATLVADLNILGWCVTTHVVNDEGKIIVDYNHNSEDEIGEWSMIETVSPTTGGHVGALRRLVARAKAHAAAEIK